jgi:hypothetical protein
VNCPTCQRDNDPRRHYCGRCGANLSPVCRGCHFVNSAEDRFCGGCGDLMTWSAAASAPHAAPPVAVVRLAPTTLPPPVVHAPPPPRIRPPTVPAPTAPAIATITPKRTDVITAGDLAELLAAATAPAAQVGLPESNIGQDDLDALFGGVP